MARIGSRLVLVALAAALAAAPALAGRASTNRASMPAPDRSVLVQLNAIRSQHGLVTLKPNAQLAAAAAEHSSDMLAHGYFAHSSFNGGAFWERLARYTAGARHGGWSVGENLLWSAPDVDAVHALKLWMASPEHRANILNPDWRQIGIAAVNSPSAPGTYGGRDVTVVTTDFGVRR